MNIFVAKLHFSTDSDALRGLFEKFGEVESAKVVMDRDTGRSKCFGFVEMPDDIAAQKAIAALNETELHGAPKIVVKKAEPRADDNGGGSKFGGGGFNRGGGGGFNRNNDRNTGGGGNKFGGGGGKRW